MASAPQNDTSNLPMFYNDLAPVNSGQHGDWSVRSMDFAPFLVKQHAVPLTVDEFPMASRSFPIVFSAGNTPVPLALMGLNEGVNVFMGEDGKFLAPTYVPAYVRRYPFMLAKLQPDAEELSLCFDPTSEIVGVFDEGEKLFENGEPTQPTKNALEFCENFEQAGERTGLFMEEMKKADLLMDGEVSIQQEGVEKPFVYRGFGMVNEEKLREMRGDELRKMNQSGMLPLVYAHLFSLQIMQEVFAQQVSLGLMPEAEQLNPIQTPA